MKHIVESMTHRVEFRLDDWRMLTQQTTIYEQKLSFTCRQIDWDLKPLLNSWVNQHTHTYTASPRIILSYSILVAPTKFETNKITDPCICSICCSAMKQFLFGIYAQTTLAMGMAETTAIGRFIITNRCEEEQWFA